MVTPIGFYHSNHSPKPSPKPKAKAKAKAKAPEDPSTDGTHKTWIYTCNNYTDEEITRLKALVVSRHRCCKEVGDEGTPHLQGAVTFKRVYRHSQLSKLIPRVIWIPAINVVDPENYCIKGEIIIDINNAKQGKRNDLKDAIATATESGIVAMARNHPETFVRYHRGIQELLYTIYEAPPWVTVEVIVLWGPPGSGKSRLAREIDPKLFNVPEPVNGSIWFNGYRGQKTILLDDFYGGWGIKYHTMLQLLDGYEMQMPVKGTFTHKQWNKVIITSNKPPEEWYTNVDDTSALLRRLTKVQHVTVTEVGDR